MKAFFDSNVLVYTATSDARKQRAVDCLGRGGVVSVQVLNESDCAAREALKFSPRDPWPRSIAASPPIASMSAAIIRRRSACRARRCGSAATLSAPTAC